MNPVLSTVEGAVTFPARAAATDAPDHQPDAQPTPDAVAPPLRARHDGWSPERQRTFCERIAEGYTVEDACRVVQLTISSAYAFRRRANGSAFALGWDAARLLARDTVADTLLSRALDGQTETVTRPNGDVVERFRYDNRLASQMLARLDRYADGQGAAAPGHAARLIAQEFNAYLDLLQRDGATARAGLFLGLRVDRDATGLDSVVALARADGFLRSGAGLAAEVDTADLDPAQRADWTAGQWARAEAAGLLTLAPPPPPEPAPAPQLPPLPECSDTDNAVWFDEEMGEWHTNFPPPEDFNGWEDGAWSEDGYSRDLTDAECAVVEPLRLAEFAERLAEDAALRDAWFAGKAAALAEASADGAEDRDRAADREPPGDGAIC